MVSANPDTKISKMTFAPPPKLPEIKIEDLEEIERQAKLIEKHAQSITTWVLETLKQVEMTKGLKRIANEVIAPKVEKAFGELEILLRGPTDPEQPRAYRRAAWLGVFLFEFGRDISSREEAQDLLSQLVKKGYLVEDSAGRLKAWGQGYTINPDSFFDEPEILEANEMLRGLLDRVYEEVRKDREQRSEKLRAQATISIEELRAGKPGKCFVEVPPEEASQNGRKFWRGGGSLLVWSNGRDIWPLDASGSIEGAIQEALRLRVPLMIYSLQWNKPPIVPGLDLEREKKLQLLWYLIKRALRYQEEMGRIENQHQDFGAIPGLLTLSEFFLEGKFGPCLAEHQRTWKVMRLDGGTEEEISNLFFVVERLETEEGAKIRILKLPEHLKNLLASCTGQEFQERDKFEGVAQPLKMILQAIYGQVAKSVQINGK